jgi:DNA-binding CsgD family transcriptional regulator/PAS domain-containing protein
VYDNPEQAFGGASPLMALIETIYSAVQQPLLWRRVLDQISEAVHGEQNLLFATLPGSPIPNVLPCSKTNPDVPRLFTSYYATVNVLAEPCEQMFPSGTVRYSHWAVPDAEFERSEFYTDFFKPLDMHYSIGLKIPLGNQSLAYWSMQRAKSRGGFDDSDGIVLSTLMPHLRRALELHLQFQQLRTNVLGLETALDSLEHAVFGLSREGRVVFSNRRAEAVVRAEDAIRLNNGSLSSIFPEQNCRLQAALTDAVAAGSGMGISPGTSLLLDRRSGESPLRITVTPFVSPLAGSSGQLAALVFVSDSSSRPQSRGTILRTLYGLTPTEARIADRLLDGMNIKELGSQLGLTLETARFHVKRILSKTGARRQTELMRMMLSLPQA